MPQQDILAQAEYTAWKYHAGQVRKKAHLPYVVHPTAVVGYLTRFGVQNDRTLAIAWLHDTLEDTELTYAQIQQQFGQDIADGVLLMTQQGNREEYIDQIKAAPLHVRMVKLCDTLDNLTTLGCLSPEGIQRKQTECKEMYIPMARHICPPIAEQMKTCINGYRNL